MHEKPIILATWEVQAVLEGRKTQIRRPIKVSIADDVVGFYCDKEGNWWTCWDGGKGFIGKCPYPLGTKLWVRETWQIFFEDEIPPDRYKGPRATMGIQARPGYKSYYCYLADGEMIHPEYGVKANWCSSANMPRAAARMGLEVVDRRIEKVGDITEEDAKAEGVSYEIAMEFSGWTPTFNDPDGGNAWPNYREAFKDLWSAHNAKKGYPFESSPWAWVYEIKRLS